MVDAVAWVLGAQGPRTLRSAKMEDVIFMGTASRPALGRAEVSLTIDNSAGKLATDLAEMTITRTLFRSGDSEYSINGAPCRLLDIQELLSDTGVGRQQHVIISQGHLDAILEARPEDRRSVIEEAAGVLKFRRRRERSERRLASTEENLERLFDLVREVKRQIRPLERQAAAARSYTGLADELRAVRLYVAGSELEALDRATARGPRPRPSQRASEARLPRSLGASSTPTPSARPTRCRPSGSPTWPPPSAGPRAWWSGPGVSPGCSGSASGRWPRRSTPPPTPTWSPPWRPRAPGWPRSSTAAEAEAADLAPEQEALVAAEVGRWPPSSRPTWRPGGTGPSCARPRRP